MTEADYVFHDTESDAELARLQALEAEFDGPTRAELLATGLSAGWRCLEVGAGAGSIAHWMADRVGPTGYVAAIDIDKRFLSSGERDNLGVIEGDIRTAVLEPNGFDLVHARYVLIHMPDWDAAFRAMLYGLKPEGWMVLEEPDFSMARISRADDRDRAAFENVKRAIAAMFAAGGMDHTFGARLDGAIRDYGLQDVHVSGDTPLVAGGSRLATLMGSSASKLRNKYVSSGEASPDDVDTYIRSTSKPRFQATFYETVRARGRKPAAPS